MRIWHQSYTDIDRLPEYARWLRRHSGEYLGANGVDVHGVRAVEPGAILTTEDRERAIVAAAVEAERHGYDAFTIGCIYDPALAACRAAVNIPVLSLADSIACAATMQGPVGLVVLEPQEVSIVVTLMQGYGLSETDYVVVAAGDSLTEADLEQLGAMSRTDGAESADAAYATAHAAGAHTVYAAEGVLNEYLWSLRDQGSYRGALADSNALMWGMAAALVQSSPGSTAQRSTRTPAAAGAAEPSVATWFVAAGRP